jgi:tetratricopeptide (TPR) repeat protein
MQTHFSSHSLAEVFRDLYLGERSGVLHLTRGDVHKRIYFDRGMILHAESNQEEEDLGKRLVSEGKISPGALAEARRNVSETKDLPQALINRGLIGKETLSHTVRFLVERVVQSVFRWEGGTARFEDGWLIQEILESDILLTFEVILKGISAMHDFDPIREALRGLDQRMAIKVPTPVPVERLALSPAHGYILSRVDGSSRVRDVLALLPPGEDDLACRFLYGLLVMGVLALDPPLGEGAFRVATILRDHADAVALEREQERMILEAIEAIRGKNPHEVLAVAADAPREVVEAAYEEAKARFGRDRLLPRVRDKLRSEVSILESRFVEAYLNLTQARPGASLHDASGDGVAAPGSTEDLLVRVEMDKTKTKRAIEESGRLAESYHAKARKFMKEGDIHNAIQYGKLAISYTPDDARLHFLLAECQVRNPEIRWQRMAEQSYRRAAELDPWNAEYRISLGRFYKKRGLTIRARKLFEEALRIVPSHETALSELSSLT